MGLSRKNSEIRMISLGSFRLRSNAAVWNRWCRPLRFSFPPGVRSVTAATGLYPRSATAATNRSRCRSLAPAPMADKLFALITQGGLPL